MTDAQLKKQFDKIDREFKVVHKKFDDVHKKFDDTQGAMNSQFAKLFAYMVKRFDELDTKIDTKADKAHVMAILDSIAKRLEVDDVERVALGAQVDRHDYWIGLIAKKTKTKLSISQPKGETA